MRRSDYYTKAQVQNGRDFAHAYGEPGPDGQRPDLTAQGKGDGGFGSGAGGASSTLGDLARFVRALYDGTLLDRTYTDLMTSGKHPIKPDERKPSHHAYDGTLMSAYGMDAAIVNDQRVIVRTGGAPNHGQSAYLSIYPDLDWVAVVLFNYFADLVPYLELQDDLITKQVTP
jgi:CubicO group peptidase (beta-lactamase class C family)